MLRRFFAVLVIMIGVAGLILPVIPGIILIAAGSALFSKNGKAAKGKDYVDIP